MRILVVDDSIAYRSKIRAALSNVAWVEVVGAASNGKLALEMLDQKSVDLVTMDLEMPVMGGLEALRLLRAEDRRTKVIVFSSTTVQGSEATLDALEAGADDFVTKPSGVTETATPEDIIRRDLLPKLEQFRADMPAAPMAPTRPETRDRPRPDYTAKDIDTFRPSALVIASSTGGPTAHDAIFNQMGGSLRCPIFIAQHMPPVFTASFAKRIAEHSGLPCKEAVHGEYVKDEIYVAPGDYHLTLKRDGDGIRTMLDKSPPRNSVRPAADPLFETAAMVYGSRCMGFVLTGMGEDGLVGAHALKAAAGGLMIQDKTSCVVFGMPAAVFNAGIYDAMGTLTEIRARIKRMALK